MRQHDVNMQQRDRTAATETMTETEPGDQGQHSGPETEPGARFTKYLTIYRKIIVSLS